jgi:hypothetical protein
VDRIVALAAIPTSVAVAIALILLPQGRGLLLARIAVPIAIGLLLLNLVLVTWSVAAFALLVLVIISAGVLALRMGTPRSRGPWLALGAFAIAAMVGGFGVMAEGFCIAGGGYGCGGTLSLGMAVAGWAVAISAYGYLAWGALRP